MATATSTTGAIAHIQHPSASWTDAQRAAWEAIRTIYLAADVLREAAFNGVLPSHEPGIRAWLAWTEAEREAMLVHFPEGV